MVDDLVEALAPSNNPVLNPSTWKALICGHVELVTEARVLVPVVTTFLRSPS